MSIALKPALPLSAKKEAILIAAAGLFSQKGYAAVSMRVLAREIGITPAALYHHYPDKEALYCAVLQYVFADKAAAITNLVGGNEAPVIRLEKLILGLAELFSGDKILTRLLHRELLDGNEVRIKLLTDEVIASPIYEIEKLMQQLAPERDPRLSAMSIIGLILGHFELMPILQNLSRPVKKHDLSSITAHIMAVGLCGLLGSPGHRAEDCFHCS
jgi:AcrR family transcriptional regulator